MKTNRGVCVCAEINDHVEDDFLANVTRTDTIKVLGFGQGSVAHGRDSRYWDRDDRRRDEDYNEDDVDNAARDESNGEGHNLVKTGSSEEKEKLSQDDPIKGLDKKGVGLYNEDGRKELRMYEAEYEASLKNAGQSNKENDIKYSLLEDNEVVDTDNEYDDGIDSHDPRVEEYNDSKHGKMDHFDVGASQNEDGRESSNSLNVETKDRKIAKHTEDVNLHEKGFSNPRILDEVETNSRHVTATGRQSTSKSRSDSKRKPKRRKFSGNFFSQYKCISSQLHIDTIISMEVDFALVKLWFCFAFKMKVYGTIFF